MWLDPYEMSKWAFYYCRDKEDKPEIRKLITDSMAACLYCADVKDRPEVRKNITATEWASWYCEQIEDDPEVRKYIKNDPEIWVEWEKKNVVKR